jgi:transcription elongation factor GreA-like protein
MCVEATRSIIERIIPKQRSTIAEDWSKIVILLKDASTWVMLYFVKRNIMKL